MTLDGASIVADGDASLASALVAAGQLELARSPKFHRPRGPSCMRGGCDGCLVRLDGMPNVMSCMTRAKPGAKLERQNVVLSAKLDVLRAADWFFPDGMNHHEMFAGVPGVQDIMQSLARRVAGLGELPEHAVAAHTAIDDLTADVLIVGAGLAGLVAACVLGRLGLGVIVLDEGMRPGGSLLSFPEHAKVALGVDGAIVDIDELRANLVSEAASAGATFVAETTLLGVLEGGDWLGNGHDRGLVRVKARARILAVGAHDGVPAIVANDLPGVLSARAAGRLLREGVLIGDAPLVVGDGLHAEAFAAAAAGHGAKVQRASLASLQGARGLSRVRGAVLTEGSGTRKVSCDAVVVDAPCAPSFELAVEAGARVTHGEPGFSVVVDVDGRFGGAPSGDVGSRNSPLFALGEVTGAALDHAAFARAASRLGRAVAALVEAR